MISALYLVAAAAHLALWGWGVRLVGPLARRTGRTPRALVLVLIPAALLPLENLRTGLGRALGPGDALYALSVPALAWHWTVLPLFALAAVAMLDEAGLRFVRRPPVVVLIAAVVTALFAIDLPWAAGLLTGGAGPLPDVELVIGCIGDAVRYTATRSEAYLCAPTDAVHRVGPGPTVAIAMVVMVLAAGVALWRARGWPWLALAAAGMFLAAAAGPAFGPYAAPLANVGEVALVAAMLATARWSALRAASTATA